MAVNDPYGLMASGMPPDLAAQFMGLSREQQIAQALMAQSQSPLESPQSKGRLAAPIGAGAAIAKVIQAALGKYAMDSSDKKMADFAAQANARRGQALQDYSALRDGSPAKDIPYGGGITNDDEGNALPPATKDAVAGNPRAAIAQALINPMLANSPLVAADLKSVEKASDPYSLKPGEKRYLGDKVVAAAPAAAVKVERAGASGMPETIFTTPDVNAPPIPAPVKTEYKDAGGSIVPVPSYVAPGGTAPTIDKTVSPDTALKVSATERGQNMTDARERELNGILQNGGSNDQIEGMADLIANKQIPPLSGYALRSPMGIRIMNRAYEKNPNLSAIDYNVQQKAEKDFATGKQGNTVRSFNVALAHLDTLANAADALDNNDVKGLNKVSQTIAEQTGQPAPTEFNAVKKIVGDEIVKAIVGSGGGVTDRQEAADTINRANSPAQLKGVISRYKELMRGQLGGLRQQYETSTGRKDFDRFLSPEGLKAAHGNPAGDKSILDAADAIIGH